MTVTLTAFFIATVEDQGTTKEADRRTDILPPDRNREH